MRRARAFSPGHVTGFFEICPHRNLLAMGSRGAGLCLSLGANSKVTLQPSMRQHITVEIDGRKNDASVTKAAVRYMIGHQKLRIDVSTETELPVGQGFGMSAAGALSSALALADLLGESRQMAFEAAHVAEITQGGGLGDVAALHRAGITIRKRAGLPPTGEVLRIGGAPEVVVAVVGRKMLTRNVLSDPKKRAAINKQGARRVTELLERPSLELLMSLSSSFAAESGLASRRVQMAIGAASRLGRASMAMLGNSVFAVGDASSVKEVLSEFGPTWECRVDREGPVLL